MEDVQQVASYISQRYEKEYGRQIGEMKLHKLLHLTRRKAIIETEEPLFEDQFGAWKYEPVLYFIHKTSQTDRLHSEMLDEETIGEYRKVFDKVFSSYVPKDSRSLSTLSHGEYSWRKACEGYDPDSACRAKIGVGDICVDAQRIKQKRVMLNVLGA